jgi:hypothetical protein
MGHNRHGSGKTNQALILTGLSIYSRTGKLPIGINEVGFFSCGKM